MQSVLDWLLPGRTGGSGSVPTDILLHPPHSPRLSVDKHSYGIFAVLYASRRFREPAPELYLRTASLAVVRYCLYGHEGDDSINSIEPPRTLDSQSQEHRQLCLRLRRCGAVELDMNHSSAEDSLDMRLERHLDRQNAIFGWPQPQGSQQPVWVLQLPTDRQWSQNLLRTYGLESHLNVIDLGKCQEMDEYCNKLESKGAVYYDDVRDCVQAEELDLIQT